MSSGDRMMVGARGGGYGLDAELARKKAANYDFGAENKAKEWVEALTNETFEGAFGESLRDGVLLCKLVNTIRPGTVKKVNESKMPFKQMENISNFLKGCRVLGVAEHSLFETVDLFEEKDIALVVQCLWALGSTIQVSVPEFQGPHLGAKLHVSQKREWTEAQKVQGRVNAAYTKQSLGSAEVMQRTEIVKTGICMGADYAGQTVSSEPTQSSMGSYGIMDRSHISKSGITFGAENSGIGDTSCPTALSQGSHGIMDRATITRTGITMGAEYSGSPSTSDVPISSLGSSGIMDRPEPVRNGPTMGAECSGAPVPTGA